MNDDPRDPPVVRPTAADDAPDPHPAPEELVAFHRRALSRRATERLLDHLAACRECTDLLLDYLGLPDLPLPGDGHPASLRDATAALLRLAESRARGGGDGDEG